MQKLLCAGMALLAIWNLSSTAANAAGHTPLEFLFDIYGYYQNDDADALAFRTPDGARRVFTKEAARLVVKDSDGGTAIGNLDFDPFTCSQDWQPTHIQLGPQTDTTPDATVMLARFAIGGTGTAIIHYDLARTTDGWRIANIHWSGDCIGKNRDLIGVLKGR